MRLLVQGIPSEHAGSIRAGGPDANGQAAIARAAEGARNPCRHCLQLMGEGERMLVLAYRPFAQAQPYAEVGPIFLHERECPRYEGESLPDWFRHLQPALVRGYGHDDWIRYETGAVLPGSELEEACRKILADPATAYVHVRSRFNCFQVRVDRA